MLGAFDLQDPRPGGESVGGTDLSIRPEVFLYPPWHGTGLICDAFGLPSDRYEVRGHGRTEADGAVVIEHRAEFASGIVNAYEWRFGAAQGDLVYARDQLNGIEAKGRMTARGFRWMFIAIGHTPFGRRRCRVEIDYRMLSPQEAASTITLSLLGVTVATGSSHIRHDSLTDSKAA
jgi:hypothetical protein